MTNILLLARRDKAWRQCLERAFASHNDVFTIMTPTISMNTSEDQIPNATIQAHPPGEPNNTVPYTITFVDFMDPDRSDWDEIASRHADTFLKIYRKRMKDHASLAQARKLDHLP